MYVYIHIYIYIYILWMVFGESEGKVSDISLLRLEPTAPRQRESSARFIRRLCYYYYY